MLFMLLLWLEDFQTQPFTEACDLDDLWFDDLLNLFPEWMLFVLCTWIEGARI